MMFQGQPWKIIHETPISKTTSENWTSGVADVVRVLALQV
jgi:hypothetical protein